VFCEYNVVLFCLNDILVIKIIDVYNLFYSSILYDYGVSVYVLL